MMKMEESCEQLNMIISLQKRNVSPLDQRTWANEWKEKEHLGMFVKYLKHVKLMALADEIESVLQFCTEKTMYLNDEKCAHERGVHIHEAIMETNSSLPYLISMLAVVIVGAAIFRCRTGNPNDQAYLQKNDDLLNTNNIKEMLDEMWNYRARWKFIGVELGIDVGTLDAIEKDCKMVDDCLLRMITSWLGNCPRPTREVIKVALQSKHVSNATADYRKSEVTDDKLEEYTAYLKSLYKAKTQASFSGDDHWPPPVTDKVFSLAMIMPEQVLRRKIDDCFVRETITGKIDDILQRKVPITLEQIFDKCQQKKMLIEGAPGCGKSTLSLHICHEWIAGRLLTNYCQVVLVKLREMIVQNAENIADILPKRNNTMGKNAEEKITAHDGEGVLFIFDGWDELPEKAPGHSVIQDILDCNKLHKSTVLITSRPISSMNLHSLVNTRIEILGFTKAELRKYFIECLEDDRVKVKKLQQRIKENPVVEGSCYLITFECQHPGPPFQM